MSTLKAFDGVVVISRKLIFLLAALVACTCAWADDSPAATAEHRLLVDQCVARSGSQDNRAECEQVQRQIDAALRMPLDRSPAECAPGATTCGATAGGEPRTAFAGALDKSLADSSPSSWCDSYSCLLNAKPNDPLDKINTEHRLQLETQRTEDHIVDMILPGFGRWEQRRGDVDYRLDYINPRRCSRHQRVGICFTIELR
jgi:hypothetical protein